MEFIYLYVYKVYIYILRDRAEIGARAHHPWNCSESIAGNIAGFSMACVFISKEALIQFRIFLIACHCGVQFLWSPLFAGTKTLWDGSSQFKIATFPLCVAKHWVTIVMAIQKHYEDQLNYQEPLTVA